TPAGHFAAFEVQFDADPGKLIFLPTFGDLEGAEIQETAQKLLESIANILATDPGEPEPAWIDNWNLFGLNELTSKVEIAREQVRFTQAALEAAESNREKILVFKKLLWATGKFQLEPTVREALALLGFSVTPEGDCDAVLYEDGQKTAIVEIEGSTGRIAVEKYRQLLDYVQNDFEATGTLVKGILVGNGSRLRPPEERGDQFTEHCRTGARSQGYCLLSTTELFRIVEAILKNPEPEFKKGIRQKLLSTVGDFVLKNDNS
ncbi:MAG: hypothetical protein HYX93_03170, partial [Chloroflexi bacterium]|nr:hypothetical protein [Chloroflexota bacterium]